MNDGPVASGKWVRLRPVTPADLPFLRALWNDGPVVSGRRVRLRPVTPADLPFLRALWNDGQVMQHVGFPAGLRWSGERMARWWEQCQDWTATHLIVENQAGVPLGESGWGFLEVPGLLEIKLARAHWGKGYANDALKALLDTIFGQTAIDQVIVTPHPENRAAQEFYRRFDFRPAAPPPSLDCGDCESWTLDRGRFPVAHPPDPTTMILDWGGVVMRTEDDSRRRRWEAQLGLPAGGVDGAVFGGSWWRAAQLGELTPDQCWEAIGASLGLASPDLDRFRHDFWTGDRLNQVLIQRIRDWRARGYRVALLSNFTVELEALLREHRLHLLFEPAVISAREQLMKPAARLFWRTLNRMRICPAQAIFVDDSTKNVAGARNVGLRAVQFQDTQQAIAEIEELLP